MAEVKFVKDLGDGVLINLEYDKNLYKIPFKSEEAKREFLEKIRNGYEVVFTDKTVLELGQGSSDSSIAFYRANWGVIQGEFKVRDERKWSWEAGSAGGSGVKKECEFEKGSIVWVYENFSEWNKPKKVVYVVGSRKEYLYLNDEIIENAIKEYFPESWEAWREYAKKQGWDGSLNVLTEELKEARHTLERFLDEEDFTPENYELVKKARALGIYQSPFGNFPVTRKVLEELIETVEKYGWKFYELEWIIGRGRPWNHVIIYYENEREFDVGEEVKKLAKEVAKKLQKEGKDVGTSFVVDAIRGAFLHKELDPKELGEEVIVREGGVGRFKDCYLVYCRKDDWDKVKARLEKYATQQVKKYLEEDYDEEEGLSPSR